MRRINIWIGFIIGLAFFVVALVTLPHYGINWDTINHLPRGQVYLRYLFLGKKNYSDLPKYFDSWDSKKWYWQKPESLAIDTDIPRNQVPTRSMYQIDSADFSWFMEYDGGGHPPLSDILSALFNRILFGKLRLINDIDSYRIYGILLAASLVGLIYWWTTSLYGKFTGFISAAVLATYPFFWSEAHFNGEKDIPETVYWSFSLFSIWYGLKYKKPFWLLLFGVFLGLALGTKFNIVFLPFMVLPWLIYLFFSKKHFKKPLEIISKNKKLIFFLAMAPVIALAIFVLSWPYLWPDPLKRISEIVGFYKGIGTTKSFDPRFISFFGINSFAIFWISTTTPELVIFLFLVGFITSLVNFRKEKFAESLLFLLWFLIPVIRVTLPKMTIYGGIRQIMEYIPAMAILTGIGAGALKNRIESSKFKIFKHTSIKLFFCILISVLLLYPNVRLHPNENVYFNSLIGGLKGAKEKDIPFWGNSFGAPYRQAAVWMNKNLPHGANLAYARELLPNIPRIWLRPDIVLHNSFRSGYLEKGEYIVALTYQGTEKTSYFDRYLDRIVEPIYEVKVDSVPILKIWKNDTEHTKKEYLSEKEVDDFSVSMEGNATIFDFDKVIYLSRLEALYREDLSCRKITSAYVELSEDGNNWERLPGSMPNEDWNTPQIGIQPGKDNLVIPFAGDKLRYLKLVSNPPDSCMAKIKNIKIYYFDQVE